MDYLDGRNVSFWLGFVDLIRQFQSQKLQGQLPFQGWVRIYEPFGGEKLRLFFSFMSVASHSYFLLLTHQKEKENHCW